MHMKQDARCCSVTDSPHGNSRSQQYQPLRHFVRRCGSCHGVSLSSETWATSRVTCNDGESYWLPITRFHCATKILKDSLDGRNSQQHKARRCSMDENISFES